MQAGGCPWYKTIMAELHLNVIHDTHGRDVDPSSAARLFNPQRTEFRWNDDFTAYRPIALRWWDDASYARYQAGDDA